MQTPWLDLDLHRLELRFAAARLVEPRAVERIACSIEVGGQIVPCIAVAEAPVTAWQGSERLVLVDGYRRVAALRRLGRDTARVECWSRELSEALLGVLARANAEHARHLLQALEETPLSTRALRGWFGHYQSAGHTMRQRLVDHPRLFVEAQQERAEQERVRAAPRSRVVIARSWSRFPQSRGSDGLKASCPA
jgi:ParB-like nuclease domain